MDTELILHVATNIMKLLVKTLVLQTMPLIHPGLVMWIQYNHASKKSALSVISDTRPLRSKAVLNMNTSILFSVDSHVIS